MLMNSVRVRDSIITCHLIIQFLINWLCAYDMYTYILNCLLVCRTFIHVCTYMFLCNYNAFLSIESLRWIVSNTCNYTVKLQISVWIRYILCSLLPCITSRMPHLASYHYCGRVGRSVGSTHFPHPLSLPLPPFPYLSPSQVILLET